MHGYIVSFWHLSEILGDVSYFGCFEGHGEERVKSIPGLSVPMMNIRSCETEDAVFGTRRDDLVKTAAGELIHELKSLCLCLCLCRRRRRLECYQETAEIMVLAYISKQADLQTPVLCKGNRRRIHAWSHLFSALMGCFHGSEAPNTIFIDSHSTASTEAL